MKKIAERQYLLNAGETATVQVAAIGTARLVNFDLDGHGGPLGQGQPIPVPKPASGLSTLTLLFTFSGSSGGQYVVTITGSAGGSDTDTIDQGSFGIPSTSSEYLFQ